MIFFYKFSCVNMILFSKVPDLARLRLAEKAVPTEALLGMGLTAAKLAAA